MVTDRRKLTTKSKDNRMGTTSAATLDDLLKEAPKRLPPKEGKLTVRGLDGAIKIYTDKHGVPHIKVTSDHDAWFAQGFVHAQERLWGMERTRRFFHGTLAQIVGEGGVGPDVLYRRVGIMRSARREWPYLEKKGKLVIEAYVEGVNAYIEQGFPLPIEFEILNYTPAPWHPTDVTGRWKLISYAQSLNGQVKLGRLRLLKALGVNLFSKIFPYYPEDAPVMVPSAQEAGQRPMDDLLDLFAEAHSQASIGEQNGSNSWVVDGTLTKSGRPLIAGDTHQAIAVPSFWHMQHVEGPNFAFMGASMPGVPGVSYHGHNGHVAWGMTTAGADTQDLFIEQIRDGAPPKYLFKGEWYDAQLNIEEIHVKGRSEPLVEKVLETHHGPVVSGWPNKDADTVTLQWMGYGIQQTFSSFADMHSAKTVSQFIESHRQWTSHTNKIMTDSDGNIAYMLTGQLPTRAGGPAHLPVPGWTGKHEWGQEVPFEEMPITINPSNHFCNNSNNLIVGYEFPHYISVEGPPYRAQRVIQMLKELGPFDQDVFGKMQIDRFNIPGSRMASRVSYVSPKTDLGQAAKQILSSWDGHHESGSVGGTIYEVLKSNLYDHTLGHIEKSQSEDKNGKIPIKNLIVNGAHFMYALEAMIINNEKTILSLEEFPYDNWDEPLADALDSTAEQLSSMLGNDTSTWTWGRLHSINFRHGIGREEPSASLLNVGDFPAGGSGDTVNVAGYSGGPGFSARTIPTYRQIIDVGNFDNSLFIIPPGQSGHVSSHHYNDLVEDYLNARYRPMLWKWESIQKETETEQVLEPPHR